MDMPSQLENIKTLHARNFNWKNNDDNNKELDYGFIAQEVYSIYPSLNPILNNPKYADKKYPKKSDGSDFIFGLDYGKMTPYLWAGTRELIERVESLEKIVNELEKKLENKL